MNGMIMDIQKFCLQDGPGIRTTVFFKGCNMQCKWCHNPESMEGKPVLMYQEEKCVRCGKCREVCPKGVHLVDGQMHEIDRSKCEGCNACVKECPVQALSMNGYQASAEQVFAEICKDEKYYVSSGGGVTFSGGEATLQFDFLKELLSLCREKKYHTAVETNGLVSKAHLEELIELTDLFLFDYKVTGEEAHEKWTGVPGKPVLESLALIEKKGGKVVLRCPIIPGVNDTQMHFAAIRKLKEMYSCIEHVEIMAYHDTGKGKWKECGKEYELAHIKTVSAKQKQIWEAEVNRQED